MKKVMIAILSLLITETVLAGTSPISDDLVRCESKKETVLRTDFALDRGNNKIPYKIVMIGQRCFRRSGNVVVSKNLFINYDAPKVRQENDGLLQARTSLSFLGKKNVLGEHPFVATGDSAVTEEGLIMHIAGAIVPDSDLSVVPEGFKADSSVAITVFGNAFQTHHIKGPFDQ